MVSMLTTDAMLNGYVIILPSKYFVFILRLVALSLGKRSFLWHWTKFGTQTYN